MSKETTRCIIKHVNNKSQSSQGSFVPPPLVSALHDSPIISKGSGASLSSSANALVSGNSNSNGTLDTFQSLSIQSSESHTNMSSSDMQDSDAHGTLQSSKAGRNSWREGAPTLKGRRLHASASVKLRNSAQMTSEGLFLASTQLTPRPLGELREASTPSAPSYS